MNRFRLRLVGALTAAMLTVGAIMAPAASASSAPVITCTKLALGSSSTYNFPTDCDAGGAGTLLPAGTDTIYINIVHKCASAVFDTMHLKMNFNGNFGADYDWVHNGVGEATSFLQTSNATYMQMGTITCDTTGDPANSSSGTDIIVPFASSTVWNKQVMGHSGVMAFNTIQTEGWDVGFGGTWHRAAVGAVNRVDLATETGVNFMTGTRISFYAR